MNVPPQRISDDFPSGEVPGEGEIPCRDGCFRHPEGDLRRRSIGGTVFSQSAFTLVELLATLAIFGVLAVMLIGGVSGARQTSQQAKCISNIRQIGQAMILYAGENEGKAPASYPMDWPEWIKALYRGGYIASLNVLACPSDSNRDRNIDLMDGAKQKIVHNSYGANECFIADWNLNFSRVNSIANASLVPLVADCTATVFDGSNADQRARITNANDMSVWTTTTVADPKLKRHKGGNSIFFVDGHAEVIDQETTQNGFLTGKIRYNPKE